MLYGTTIQNSFTKFGMCHDSLLKRKKLVEGQGPNKRDKFQKMSLKDNIVIPLDNEVLVDQLGFLSEEC